jgi:hypothetical protein
MKATLLSKPESVIPATLFLIALAFFMSADSSVAGVPEYTEFQVMMQSEDEIVFAYRPGGYEWRESAATNGKILSVENCCLNPRIGEARFPLRKVLIGIPLNSDPTVQVLSAAFTQPLSGALAVNRPIES